MSASRWTRLLTGVAAGHARLRGALGAALRPAIASLLRRDSIHRFGESVSARFRPASDAVMGLLRSEIAAFRAEFAAFRTSLRLQVDVVEEGRDFGEESSRVLFSAFFRRFRTRWKTATDALADYNRLKSLYDKMTTKRRKKEEPKPRPQLQPAPPAPAPAEEKTPTPAPPCRDARGWAIISRVPIISGTGEGEIAEVVPGDADFVVEWRVPLAVSTIRARPSDFVSAAPVAPGRDDFPYVVAVDDDAAVFLLRALPQGAGGRSYMLCHAASGEAMPLPMEFAHLLLNVRNMGLACAGRLVIELQPLPAGRAILQRFQVSSDGHWRRARATVGYPPGVRPWAGNGVITHCGRLFFVDLSQGLLSCDPLADKPQLDFVPLPEGCATAAADAEDISKSRCVSVSGEHVLYVQMDLHGGGVLLRTWSLNLDGAAQWAPRRQVQLPSTRFRSPVLALLHPKNPDVICLCDIFVVPWMLAFDMETQGLVAAQPLAVPGVPWHMLSSSAFHGSA